MDGRRRSGHHSISADPKLPELRRFGPGAFKLHWLGALEQSDRSGSRMQRWIGIALVLAAFWTLESARAADTVTYYYTSPQGTVLAKADTAGNLISTADYRPYGSQGLGTPEHGPGYTGHVNDVNSGLVYVQARYYDSEVGQFLSPDPAPVRAAGANFNRDVYAGNNPVRFVDPDGWDITCTGHLRPGACRRRSAFGREWVWRGRRPGRSTQRIQFQ